MTVAAPLGNASETLASRAEQELRPNLLRIRAQLRRRRLGVKRS